MGKSLVPVTNARRADKAKLMLSSKSTGIADDEGWRLLGHMQVVEGKRMLEYARHSGV